MTKYTILKNWHYAFFFFRRFFGWSCNKKQFIFYFKLSNECWWSTPRNNDDYDLNKLAGLSFGVFGIHNNSVRLVWRPNFDKPGYIDIYGYTYDSSKKEHTSLYLCEIQTDREYNCLLDIENDKYIFDMGYYGRIEMENKTTDPKLQHISYPYFGGNNKSPHKMSMWVEIKKGYWL